VARYERGYTGERQTELIGLHVTPSLRAKLKAGAAASGAPSLNAYLNELLEVRAAVRAAATRRNPEAAALARELRAIGINFNQIARFENSTGERERQPGELRELESLIKQALRRVIAL
jgi:Bacterial mobilisation protein (MobC)